MTGVAGLVAVAADRALVAETLAAALTACGLAVVRLPWDYAETADHPQPVPPEHRAAQGILLCELDPARIGPARRLMEAYPSQWLLLTDAPPGPAWGALLDAGVVGVLPSSVTLDGLLTAIEQLAEGRQPAEVPDRGELVAAWHEAQARRADARAHLSTLTRRERRILELLGSGLTVPQIAELDGVAPSTVRSQVRSVLHKLGVHSQLAAVAILLRAQVGAPQEHGHPPTG